MNRLFGIFAYHPHGTFLPDHAKLVSTFPGQNHGNYSVLIQHFAPDTGYEGITPDPVYGADLLSLKEPFRWPPARKVYIDALTEPGLRPKPQIGHCDAPSRARQTKVAA